MKTAVYLLFASLLVFSTCSRAQPPQKKIALVIGVQNYTALPPLRNSLNDASMMSASLKNKGFVVETLYDPKTKKELRDAITRYYNVMREQTGAVGIIFYAGHGMQYDGENYIIPASTVLQSPGDLDEHCVKMNTIMAVLKSSSKSLNILLLDACRSLPSFTRATEQGLTRMEAPQGTIIVYATQPGKVASDGTDKNGLFTSRFLRAMNMPNLNITDVLKKVKQDVYGDSKESQLPSVEDNSLGGDFYFTPVQGDNVVEVSSSVADPVNDESLLKDDFGYGKGVTGKLSVGNQEWMAMNLNVGVFSDGSAIQEAKTPEAWKEAHRMNRAAWSYYNNDASLGVQYGKLYNWYAVMDSRGLCPSGWHVPSDEEWTIFTETLGINGGRQLKAISLWNQNGQGDDTHGFKALPAGYRSYDGLFYAIGSETSWWTATSSSSNSAWSRNVRSRSAEVVRGSFDKENGYSVRCIKN